MRGANLEIDVDALAMLGNAVGQLAGAPVLALFDLGALFGAGVLDRVLDFLDFVFRGGRRPMRPTTAPQGGSALSVGLTELPARNRLQSIGAILPHPSGVTCPLCTVAA
jgi:hypothetical protein